MACQERLDGALYFTIFQAFFLNLLLYISSAEALVQLLIADVLNQTWGIPDWFPHHLLTTYE